jgi:hypothetical protein
MTDDQNDKYIHYRKKAWIIYALLAVALASVLVLLVAQDNEERFFYGLMTIASAYVFRPTERYLDKLIFKFTGVQVTDK